MASATNQQTELSLIIHLTEEDHSRAVRLARDQNLTMDELFRRALKAHEEDTEENESAMREELARMNLALDGMIDTIRENRASIRETLDAIKQQRVQNDDAAEKAA